MGREIRRVPQTWEHPKNERGQFIPLFDGYNKALADFTEKAAKDGMEAAIDWYGGGPRKEDYMPDWPAEERTHLMMYEDCSEGTPISPAFATPDELAHWLADNGASAFGSDTATYEQWLAMCKRGWAPSMVIDGAGARSGVADSSNTSVTVASPSRGGVP